MPKKSLNLLLTNSFSRPFALSSGELSYVLGLDPSMSLEYKDVDGIQAQGLRSPTKELAQRDF
jgi:hypothetical protein